MNQETMYWYIGLSVSLFAGVSVAVGLYVANLFNSGPRKVKRDERNEKKRKEKEKLALNKLNLDGIEIVKFANFYFKRLDSGVLIKEYKAVIDRFLPKTLSPKALAYKNKNFLDEYVPFDHNIVEIPRLKDEEQTATESKDTEPFYINGSWIPGSRGERHYIATQVPLRRTIWDFWQMVWDFRCQVIVMIGEEEIESSKIFNYTDPDSYRRTRGPPVKYKIKIEHSHDTMDFKIRTIKLINVRLEASILITHMQFLNWTSVRMTKPHVILDLRRRMKMAAEASDGPVVVHCITGCGRTGTFISIANLCDFVDKCKEERRDEKISIPHEVIRMRENRIKSVANLTQYRIIYETLLHYIVGGITAIPINRLQEEMTVLSVRSVNNRLTKFQRQFDNTNHWTEKLSLVDCAGGIRDENIEKNRHPLIIPRDRDRPYLKNLKLKGTSDYINGVYVDSFFVHGHFLVTQWPMQNTINDVWRLLFDKNIQVMIVLNVFENSKKYPQFWPTILNQKTGCGPISVELTRDTMVTPGIRRQEFILGMINFEMKLSDYSLLQSKGLKIKRSKISDKVSWNVAIFHLLNWKNNNDLPDQLHELINLIWVTEEYNLTSGLSPTTRSSIAVMSEDGAKRAGVYCVVASCLDRMRLYGEVDVYSEVMNVKRMRPQLICNMNEYLLCYDLCLEYMIWSESAEEEHDNIDADIP